MDSKNKYKLYKNNYEKLSLQNDKLDKESTILEKDIFQVLSAIQDIKKENEILKSKLNKCMNNLNRNDGYSELAKMTMLKNKLKKIK